jgi:nucleoside-diphosphate-sugar epimerase
LNNGKSLDLGTGHATSVKQLLDTVQHVTGKVFHVQFGPRLKGDSPALLADNSLAKKTIGWSPGMTVGQSSARLGTEPSTDLVPTRKGFPHWRKGGAASNMETVC